jgi:hypothetical protein
MCGDDAAHTPYTSVRPRRKESSPGTLRRPRLGRRDACRRAPPIPVRSASASKCATSSARRATGARRPAQVPDDTCRAVIAKIERNDCGVIEAWVSCWPGGTFRAAEEGLFAYVVCARAGRGPLVKTSHGLDCVMSRNRESILGAAAPRRLVLRGCARVSLTRRRLRTPRSPAAPSCSGQRLGARRPPGCGRILGGAASAGGSWELSAERQHVAGVFGVCRDVSVTFPEGCAPGAGGGCAAGHVGAGGNLVAVVTSSTNGRRATASLVGGVKVSRARTARISFRDGRILMLRTHRGPRRGRQPLGTTVRYDGADALSVTSAAPSRVTLYDRRERRVGGRGIERPAARTIFDALREPGRAR